MRNVNRLAEPKVLRQNAYRWTEELLRAIAEANRTNGKVRSSLWSRYNHREIRECLNAMFSGLCCYCEGRVGDVAYENIEHRKPKTRFHSLTFAWTNLHLACPRCNQAKGDKWDTINEILDAVDDNPISSHLQYAVTRAGVLRDGATERGAITIDHTDLNREGLLRTRQEVFNDVMKTVLVLRDKEKKQADAPTVRIAKEQLRLLFSCEHGSLIRFVADRVLDSV